MAFNIDNLVFAVASFFSGHSAKEAIARGNGGEIYRIWFDNDPSGKCYVGQTIQGSLKRIRQHVEDAQSGDDGCPLLDAATRKFGLRHMRYEILEQGIETHEDLDAAEKYWISHYNSQDPGGYNVKSGGQKKSKTFIDQPTKIRRKLGDKNPIAASIVEGFLEKQNVNPFFENLIRKAL